MRHINPYLIVALVLLGVSAVLLTFVPSTAAIAVVLKLGAYVAGAIGLVVLAIELVKGMLA